MSSINPMILIDKKVDSHLIQKFDSQVNLYVKLTQNHPIQFLAQTVNILKVLQRKIHVLANLCLFMVLSLLIQITYILHSCVDCKIIKILDMCDKETLNFDIDMINLC